MSISKMTFVSAQDFDGGSWDGFLEVRDEDDGSWAGIRSSQTLRVNTGGPEIENQAKLHPLSSIWKTLNRGFATFDTSSLPDGAYVLGARLGMRIGNTEKAADEPRDLDLVVAAYPTVGSADTLAPSDYTTFWKQMEEGDEYGRFLWRDLAFAEGSRLTTDLNTAGLSAISKTGWTGFSFLLSFDYENTEPSNTPGNDYVVDVDSADLAYGREPVLEVEYIESDRSQGQGIGRRRFELPREDVFTPTRFGTRGGRDILRTQIQDYLNEQPNLLMRSTITGPNSEVTAAPGTLLVDLGPTSPSMLWVKTEGSGNTGWSQVRIDPAGSGYRSPFNTPEFNALEFE